MTHEKDTNTEQRNEAMNRLEKMNEVCCFFIISALASFDYTMH